MNIIDEAAKFFTTKKVIATVRVEYEIPVNAYSPEGIFKRTNDDLIDIEKKYISEEKNEWLDDLIYDTTTKVEVVNIEMKDIE